MKVQSNESVVVPRYVLDSSPLAKKNRVARSGPQRHVSWPDEYFKKFTPKSEQSITLDGSL